MAFIRLQDVGVDFPLYQGSSRSLKRMILSNTTRGNLARDTSDRVLVRALRDISVTIQRGDRLGVVGANGAGKTTLLRVLAGIFEPTYGTAQIDGHVSALLNVSVGLNLDATGRENILLRGMYMGIHPKEMRDYADEIIEFTELGSYIDMPARTYSSGMMVRLSFAISTCIKPEILVMDEWLSAGDAHFIAKAKRRMAKFVDASSVLVLASHSMDLLSEWCDKGIMLQNGRIASVGAINEVITAYRAVAL